MGTLQAVFYRARDGTEPVREFLNALNEKQRVLLQGQIAMVNMLRVDAPPPAFPLSSQVRGPLRELRLHVGREHYRVLYRRSGNLLVLLHMFRKQSKSVPEMHIETAEARWADFKRRMDAPGRLPPRPAGHDAP